MNEIKQGNNVEPKEHHKQLEQCTTRPKYRQGKKLTSVKVYTVNDESTHLLFFGVPQIKLMEEVRKTCSRYGTVISVKPVENYPDTEQFTEVYHVQYLNLSSARYAKKKLDATSFYGGVLHICYAPELESVYETKKKLKQRRMKVEAFLRAKNKKR